MKITKEPYLITTGYGVELSENYMVVLEEGLKIIDLTANKIIKEIELSNGIVVGYDIFGTKVDNAGHFRELYRFYTFEAGKS